MEQRKQLEQQIEAKRTEMIKAGLSKGFAHADTLRLSQELDALINEAMRSKACKDG